MAFWRGYWMIGGALVVALGLTLPLALPDVPWWAGLAGGGAVLLVALPATRTARRRWLEERRGRDEHARRRDADR